MRAQQQQQKKLTHGAQSAKTNKLLFGIETNIIHGIKAIYAMHSSYFDDVFYGEKNELEEKEEEKQDFDFDEDGGLEFEKENINLAKSQQSKSNSDFQTQIERDKEGNVNCIHIRNIESNMAFVFLSDLFHNCGPAITCHNVLG